MRVLNLSVAAFAFTMGAFVAPAERVEAFLPKDVMLSKAAEEIVATPIQQLWTDVYDAVARKGGAAVWRRLMWTLSGTVGIQEASALSKFVMNKLRQEVFEGQVNEKTWGRFTMELYFLMRDWWLKTPQNPKDNAELGVWHCLLHLHKDVFGPAMRGSQAVDKINAILLDPEISTIRKWVGEWRGTPGPVPSKTAVAEDTASEATTDAEGEAAAP